MVSLHTELEQVDPGWRYAGLVPDNDNAEVCDVRRRAA